LDEQFKNENLKRSLSLAFRVLQYNKGAFNWVNERQADHQYYLKNNVAMFGEDGSRLGLVRSFF